MFFDISGLGDLILGNLDFQFSIIHLFCHIHYFSDEIDSFLFFLKVFIPSVQYRKMADLKKSKKRKRDQDATVSVIDDKAAKKAKKALNLTARMPLLLKNKTGTDDDPNKVALNDWTGSNNNATGDNSNNANPSTPGKLDPDYDGETFPVFVGGLPFSVAYEQVEKDFLECGDIAILNMPHHEEGDYYGQPKGYAFIEYKTKEGQEAALKFHDTEYGNDRYTRKLNISIAKGGNKRANDNATNADGTKSSKYAKDGKYEKGNHSIDAGAKPPGCKSVILKNLAFDVTERDLKWWFGECGTIMKIHFVKRNGENCGIAFVDFEATEAVDEAIKLNDSALKNRKMHVQYSRTKK